MTERGQTVGQLIERIRLGNGSGAGYHISESEMDALLRMAERGVRAIESAAEIAEAADLNDVAGDLRALCLIRGENGSKTDA